MTTNVSIYHVVEYTTSQGWMMLGEDGHSLSHSIFKAKRFNTFSEALDWKHTMDGTHFNDYRVSTYKTTTEWIG